ncbi:MAG: DUF2806 domain-containing protein [Verrucomicrobia bacterium]|nr:DUF2806 domain-containing protein [Verrucomicrobiota bacterium]
MPEGPSYSLVNLGDFSKPADTLIKKVSKAVGGFFAPYQIKRIAKADAEAAIIRAESEIQITDLHHRAMHRFFEEEARQQKNMEEIIAKAFPQLKEGADPSTMQDDWVTNFFDRSRIVSDEEMQKLWSRVLAGEANAPGKYSKRTVNFLADLDKFDAELFAKLCGFVWFFEDQDLVPIVFDVRDKIYSSHGIDFSGLVHLESIGLIKFNNINKFIRKRLPKRAEVFYYGKPLLLEFRFDSENQLEIGSTILTKIGQELAPICDAKPVEGFWDSVTERWKQHLLISVQETGALPSAGSTNIPPTSTSS